MSDAAGSEHGTFRVRFDYPSDPGEYHSGVITTLTGANEYKEEMDRTGATAWVERAKWYKEGEEAFDFGEIA